MVARVLSFLGGILLVQQLPELPKPTWLAIPVLGLLILAKAKYWRSCFFVAGVVWAVGFASMRLADRLPESLAGQDLEIQGIVSDLPEVDDKHVRFNFRVTKAKQDRTSSAQINVVLPRANPQGRTGMAT